MGLFTKFRLGNALSSIKQAIVFCHNSISDVMKESNPLIRIYYDSKLGSPIEAEVEKAFAAAHYERIKSKLPDWKISRKVSRFLGAKIAHIETMALDRSKVLYQTSKGIITSDQAYKETAKRLTASAFAFGKAATYAFGMVGKGVKAFNEYVLEPIHPGLSKPITFVADYVAGRTIHGIRNKLFSEETQKKVTIYVEKGLKVAVDAAHKVVNFVDTAMDKTRTIVKRTAEFVSDVAGKIEERVSDFKQKVKETATTVWDETKKLGKQIFGKLFGKR